MNSAKEIPANTKVAAYIRVSTDEQKLHGLSIEAQTSDLQEWADENHLKIVDFYNDAGFSARKSYKKRPAMVRLLEDVQAGKIDLIVFTKLDRWFRSLADYYQVQTVLEAHSVNWKTIHEDYDTTTASGRLKINIMLSVAQDEADRTSERIKAVFDAKKVRKEPVSGRLPTGYRMDGKKMVKDPDTEEAVSCFFESYLATRSIQKARTMVQESCGTLFTYYHSRLMLGKEAYYGRFQGVDGMCPPYITKEQYDEICANRHRAERKAKADRTYLFTGIMFCAECGRRFGAHTSGHRLKSGKWDDGIAYNCRGRYNNGDCGNGVNIRECVIEDFLLQNVDEELRRYTYELADLASARRPARDFPAERAKLKNRLSRLKDLYVDAIIDLELYRKDYEELTARLDALAIEEREAAAPVPDAGRLLTIFAGGWQGMYESMDRTDRQAFWRSAIDKILIHPTRQITVSFRP